ncbi:hypothetical protein ACWCQQ_38440 [Streptomyces sp. NPDC002143]
MQVSGFGIDGGDGPVVGGPAGDARAPVADVGVFGGLDVLAGDQGQDAQRVRGLLSQLLLGQMAQQPQRVTDQRVDQLGAGLFIVPRDAGLTRVGAVMGSALHGHDLVGTGNLTRTAAMIWMTVSWVATSSSNTVESKARQFLPPRTPIAFTTSRTASKMRLGRPGMAPAEVDQQRWVECHLVQTSPQAAFHLRSHPSSWTVSKSEGPCRACSMIAAARICGGILGRPFAEGYMSANI